MNIVLEGGKTTPRLLIDLVRYDPRHLPPTNFNILSDIVFHDDGHSGPSLPTLGTGSCQHYWCLKQSQCDLPEDTSANLSPGTTWRFAVICNNCRSHLDVHFSFSERQDPWIPCPNEDHPLHHFIHLPELSTSWRNRSQILPKPGFAWLDRQCFECSSPECAAKLVIQYKPPRLIQEWVSQLTERQLVQVRAEQAMARDPKRFEGIAVPSPVNVLEYLLQYINNALFDPDPNRKIKSDNRKFATSFGDSCSDLLRYIGFEKEGDYWLPPRPSANQQLPYREYSRVLLDDVREELHILMSRQPPDQIRSAKFVHQPVDAMRKIAKALAGTGYSTTPRHRTVDLTVDEHPFYASLGAVADFHDVLVAYAYQCQIASDPKNIPYYLECLQVVAMGRESEDLQTKAAIEETQGRISLKDVRQAYANLGLNARDPQLADDTIIGSFQARKLDAPKQETNLRNDLRIIGENRASEKIRLVASQDVTTYEQALLFLGAEENTPDEFIPSTFSIKVGEKSSDEHIARQAVALIANHRKSKPLRNWIETGHLGAVEMDVGQAYARLDISDRTVDDATVLATYEFNMNEQPSQIEDLTRALTAIAKSRDSDELRKHLGLDFGETQHKLSEWPVGIENIGNTCYLNSLLQFYYSVPLIRHIVMNRERYKMPLDEESLKSKRVGSRGVSRKEVDRAQSFLDEFGKLGQQLMTSPTSSIRPSPDVARLTLLSSSKAEMARRQSLIAAERPTIGPGLGQINGVLVQGPVGPPPASTSTEKDSKVLEDGPSQSPTILQVPPDPLVSAEGTIFVNGHAHSDTSSDTLVDGAAPVGDPMSIDSQSAKSQSKGLENKENLPPSGSIDNGDGKGDVALKPLGESSSSRLNEQAGHAHANSENPKLIDLTGDSDDAEKPVQDEPTNILQVPPTRPPPFPPRPQVQRQTSDAIKEAEYGAQQDVTEVIANVLFQLECAIKPESVDETGEQLDQIKRLFFGKQKSYTTDKKGTIRTKEEYITDIKVDVASGPRDIYAALDGAFDVQDVEVGGGIEPQYATISQLPPILSILIQRAQFDPAKKITFKSDNHLELKDTIYMDRYMDSNDSDLNERRQESWLWKKKLAIVEQRRFQLAESDMGMPMSELLETTSAYLQQVKDIGDEDIEVPQSLISNVKGAAEEAGTELEALDVEIRDLKAKISSQFNDLQAIPYRLASVFIHVGSHNTGHYWIYIYDFKRNMWRKYNDEKVTEVTDLKEIFEPPGTIRPPTPYYLVYVKDDLKEDLIDPVCRDVDDPPPNEIQDSTMDDYQDVPVPNTVTAEMIEDTYRPIQIQTQKQQVEHDVPWNPAVIADNGHQW